MAEHVPLHNGRMLAVHAQDACSGVFCCVHNPSDHPLRGAPLNWRADRNLMERLCPHGIGHPDPDDVAHYRRVHGDEAARWYGVHGCCGCCTRSTAAAPTPPI